MHHLAESTVSSSFFRGVTPPCSLFGHPQGVVKASTRPRNAPSVIPLRCSLSSGTPTEGSEKYPLMSTARKTSLVSRKADRGDVTANAGHGETSSKFGATLAGSYDVSVPQKVSETCLSESTGADVLHRLKMGFVKFKEEKFLKESDLFQQLAEGQQPKVMVIACADSRVCPTMLMGLNPGEVFSIRNVANLVPPCEKDKGKFHGTSAALEFAVKVLKIEQIIVIGHRNCGGIKALMTRESNEIESDFIGSWISCALPAKKHTLIQMEGKSFAEQCRYCELEAINVSLANLLTYPWIKESFENGNLGLHGWFYDFVDGELTSWEVQQPTLERALEPSLVAA